MSEEEEEKKGDMDTFGKCIMCFEVIRSEVWMCPQCSAIQCSMCLKKFHESSQSNAGCPSCRAQIN